MSDYYHDASDLNLLEQMQQAAPREYKAWADLDSTVATEDGAIPRVYRELIALAVAHATQCVYCIQFHTKGAKKAGATKAQVAETILLASALRAGGAVAHGALAMKFYDQD